MKHSEAQAAFARLLKNLYDNSPEKAAIVAAAHGLAFVHKLASYSGPVSIPAQDLLKKIQIDVEPATVIEPKLRDISNEGGSNGAAVDTRSPSGGCDHDHSQCAASDNREGDGIAVAHNSEDSGVSRPPGST